MSKSKQDIESIMAQDAENQEADEVSLKKITETAQCMVDLKAKIADQEAALAELKEQYRVVETMTLPEMMNSLGMKKFTLDDGSEISVKDEIRASLPSRGAILKAVGDERDALVDRHHRALEWMRVNGGEGIIKNEVSVDFGKGQDEIAEKMIDFCRELGVQYDRSTTVHAGSLTSYIKEKIAGGNDVPFDLFGVYAGLKAIIKQPRKIG